MRCPRINRVRQDKPASEADYIEKPSRPCSLLNESLATSACMPNSETVTRYVLIIVAIGQFIAPLLPTALGIGQDIGEAARADHGGYPPEQPLSVAFSIWGVIFTLYALFAVISLRRSDETIRRVGPPLAIAGALNIIWMLNAQIVNLQLLNFALLFPIAWYATRAAAAFETVRDTGADLTKFTADAVTGLLCGWITVAISISMPVTVRIISGLGASDAPWQMLILTLTTAAAGAWAFSTFIGRNAWYFVALGWGVACVALNNWFVTQMHPMALATLCIGLVIVRQGLRHDANMESRTYE